MDTCLLPLAVANHDNVAFGLSNNARYCYSYHNFPTCTLFECFKSMPIILLIRMQDMMKYGRQQETI